MKKIKESIKKWLGIENYSQEIALIHSVNELQDRKIKELNGVIVTSERADQLHRAAQYTINQVEKLKEYFQLGADVHMSPGDSWAVFCIGGKTEYVRFVRLNASEIRGLMEFIKHFPASREDKFIDLPHGLKKEFFEI